MCHPEVPVGAPVPNVETREAAIVVPSGEAMPGLLALPERTPAPAVLILNDIFGRSPFYENLARRLALAGFVACTPESFFRLGPLPERTLDAALARAGRMSEQQTIDDLDAAISWIAALPEVGGLGVGVIGFCMGGTFALDFAALRPDLAAAVCYYGFPVARRPSQIAAPIDLVERMRVPILGLWGDQDEGVGMENVEQLRRRLVAAGKEHEFHIYPGIGHAFLSAFLEDESAPGYAVACDSWTRTIGFLRARLGAAAPA